MRHQIETPSRTAGWFVSQDKLLSGTTIQRRAEERRQAPIRAPHNIAMERLVHDNLVRGRLVVARTARCTDIEDGGSEMASAGQQHHPMPTTPPHFQQPICQQRSVWFPMALIRVQQRSPNLEDLVTCKRPFHRLKDVQTWLLRHWCESW